MRDAAKSNEDKSETSAMPADDHSRVQQGALQRAVKELLWEHWRRLCAA